jgi:peroxiredoxin Q/BCP
LAKTTVLGVSMDSVESHQRFKSKYELPFLLLSDPGGKVCEKYGVIKQKKMYGKFYKGIERSTFIINAEAKIAHAFRGIKVEGHVRTVLDTLRSS